ncbi:hypothetical protein A2U01_0116488, partial [Trifolium medium]|nr:hypothetical protein [Trifolium medium]
ESDIFLDQRFLDRSHAADIAPASIKGASGTLSRQQMIDDLKTVSKALGDKKFLVDRVVQALEAEELA